MVGGIEAVTADNASRGRHVLYNLYSGKEALIVDRWRRKEINFFRILCMCVKRCCDPGAGLKRACPPCHMSNG